MVNKKAFAEMREYMEQFDKLREQLIAGSRTILKASKAAIYAAHRGDMKEADNLLAEAKTGIKKAETLLKKDAQLAASTGAYSDALEEYTEAACYVHYLKTKEIPTAKQLGVEVEIYLSALSDVVGELVRKAINSSIKGEYKTALEIKDFVSEVYQELMLFDWRNTPVRKKFDSIKYALEKLEDLSLKIKLK
jgi:predicted translin family RNA/ssDNA-binding protein